MTWLDRLEEETSVWSFTFRHGAVIREPAVSGLRATIDGAISGAERAVTVDALRQLDSQLGWRWSRPRGLR